MSTTPGERKALLFLGAVALLGAGARLVHREPAAAPPTAAELTALERQIGASDSAAAHDRTRRPRRGARQRRAADADSSPRAPSLGGQAPDDRRQTPGVPLDIDHAPAAALESLPGIGPALAGRIVQERERGGPFGTAEALGDVRGIGPAIIRRLRALQGAGTVTFSGPPRPSRAAGTRALSDTAAAHAGRRRRGKDPTRADFRAPR